MLSITTRETLQAMSGVTWRPSDIAQVQSNFPNFTTIESHEKTIRLTELLEKAERLDL
jgi:hypothetical protein